MTLEKTLNTTFFTDTPDQAPIRKGFGTGLLAAGTLHESVVALCADLTESTQMHLFKKAFPNRFIEVGVAEQNLVTVASGMAAMGKYPFVSSYAMFSPGRNWEQIRTTVCYNDVPVCIVGSHAGISVGPDGGTHQAIEDVALMRVLPRMVVLCPCDAVEAEKMTLALAAHPRAAYLRLAREKTPSITTRETPFEIGKATVLLQNPDAVGQYDVIICATGSITHNALLAGKALADGDISVAVLYFGTVKPLDTATLLAYAQKAKKAVVTVEEHQRAGGFGSAVAEFLSEAHPTRILRIGVDDVFGQSGTPEELVAHYGLDSVSIQEKVRGFVL